MKRANGWEVFRRLPLARRVVLLGEHIHDDIDRTIGLTHRDVANPVEEPHLHPLLVEEIRRQEPKSIVLIADHEGTNPRLQSKLRQFALELTHDLAPERGGTVHSSVTDSRGFRASRNGKPAALRLELGRD